MPTTCPLQPVRTSEVTSRARTPKRCHHVFHHGVMHSEQTLQQYLLKLMCLVKRYHSHAAKVIFHPYWNRDTAPPPFPPPPHASFPRDMNLRDKTVNKHRLLPIKERVILKTSTCTLSLFLCLCLCLSLSLCLCLSVRPSVCLSVCLSLSWQFSCIKLYSLIHADMYINDVCTFILYYILIAFI